MFNLEKAINEWLQQFYHYRAYDEGAIQEMELHIRDHIDDLKSQGYPDQEAFKIATQDFGAVPTVAEEEFANQKRKTSIRSILFMSMMNNYFKTSLRSMMKNPMSSFINVFGLAMAVGACMITYAFMDFDLSTDRFHKNKDELYLSTCYVNREGTEQQYGKSPAPLAEMLEQDFTNIEKVTRIHDGNAILKYEDRVFHEQVRYVDPEFLEMFTFPLKWGAASSLHDVNSIILSEEMSIKYFGDQNPVGQEIKLIAGEGKDKLFKVSGVAKTFPKARIIDFAFLINIENMGPLMSYDFHDWTELLNATFIQVNSPSDLQLIKNEMAKYRQFQNQVESNWNITSFDFVSLHELHLASDEIRDDISYDASDEGRIGMPVIACFFLILACFNYINIAIVSAAKRLKEIGLRKVIGANRRLLILQFISENLLLTFFAGIIGFILSATIFLPWFSTISDIYSEFDLLDPAMWLFLLTILLVTGIVSGVYPAFYISRFQVVQIFKGSVKFGKKNTLTKVFLTVQLILACIGIAFAVMFAQNSWYQEKRSWGYDQKSALYVQLVDPSDYEKLKNALEKYPEILTVSGSKHHLSKVHANTILHLPDHRQYEVQEISVDAQYFETMGLQLAEGRPFIKQQESDFQSIVVNELFVKDLELTNPIGSNVKIDSIPHEIVGVVENFHFKNFYYENRAAIFTLSRPEAYQYLSLKTEDRKQVEAYKALRDSWISLFPEAPFTGGFQEDTWVGFYEDLGTMQEFTRAVAIVFVLMASLGLYGLIQLNIMGRVREFSIRKTLGANVKNLAKSVVNQYLIIFGIAVVLGIPFGHLLNTAMLDMMFPDPRPFGYSGAIISSLILVFVLTLVIATQVRRVVRANPVEGLNVES